MRRLGLMFLIIALLATVSAQAQKKNHDPKPAPPIRTAQQVYIQDDGGEGFMVFDLLSGVYTCKLCEYGYDFSGKGTVKTDGCLVTFLVVRDGYSMTAYANMCEKQAKCFVEVRNAPGGYASDPMQVTMSDSDLRDSFADCGITYPPQPVDVPLEIILQNDADGTFLLINAATGDFKFTHCADGMAMSGTGRVSTVGSLLYFEAITREYTVVASVDLAAKQGKAAIVVFEPTGDKKLLEQFITDGNLVDNVPVCGPKR